MSDRASLAGAAGRPRLGATPDDDGACTFCVWAPRAERVDVVLVGAAGAEQRAEALTRGPDGYFTGRVAGVPVGARYRYRLDGDAERPDPASRAQPDGVHGPSQVVLHAPVPESRGWRGRPLRELVLYELHVGLFTPEGTLDAATRELPRLVDLGVTAVELMPIAAFPGERNWGYDGTYPFAVHAGYGGREALGRFVASAHAQGVAVVLDVVPNHLGPEGNYTGCYGSYTTDRYRTPWGDALDFDGPGSDEVRRFFVDSAVEWVTDLGVDGLRLDAVHAIVDPTARPFLAELSDAVHAAGRRLDRAVHVIAESDDNDRRVVTATEAGGLGMDAVWADDLHHGLHAWLTGEREGYYADFGAPEAIAEALRQGWTFVGQPSRYRGRRHGSDPRGVPAARFVVCAQNHDQIGNRQGSERLTTLLDAERVKAAMALVLLSPFTPLLFMGEEHGETRPFPFFVDHGDEALREAVREGRRREIANLPGDGDAHDPLSRATFEAARLEPHRAGGDQRRALATALLALRREAILPLGDDPPRDVRQVGDNALLVLYAPPDGDDDGAAELTDLAVLVAGGAGGEATLDLPPGRWELALSTRDPRFGGPGDPLPAALDGGAETILPLPGPLAAAWRRTGGPALPR
ncbi:MAG: malto-oligosyltrehalose trehalohydrolase [Deltaproteobacteria bacterium]|nr:malto-oligosyltrehalose trehalohydrolase [Deltaproteobacteria bacterium]